MRQPNDFKTAELDGITPPPVGGIGKGRKTLAKISQGYQGPKERPGCANCARLVVAALEPDTPFEDERLSCGLGGFVVLRGSICGEHRRR